MPCEPHANKERFKRHAKVMRIHKKCMVALNAHDFQYNLLIWVFHVPLTYNKINQTEGINNDLIKHELNTIETNTCLMKVFKNTRTIR